MSPSAYILANFGGPRNAEELEIFLTSLLTDKDVTGKILPSFLHKKFFSFIAKKRAPKVLPQYLSLNNWSPIYNDTEVLAQLLARILETPVISFHRYLPETHKKTLESLQKLNPQSIVGIPLFPHFTYAVTGSIARFFHLQVPQYNITWISQFGSHTSFVSCMEQHIRNFLKTNQIQEQQCCFLFTAHGLPQRFIRQGDPYQKQCENSFSAISNRFSKTESFLCYQSKFGLGQWLKPSTKKLSYELESQKHYVLIIPFGFVSDHLETLYEIDKEYVPALQSRGYKALRLPAIQSFPLWSQTLADIIKSSTPLELEFLIK
ncbi:ferrochelatase [Chlamydia sp. 17-3921]|uniref:ferrochelatase n=1 Tax=Chlamydia sp. 17-3921 TaxID=2675798 RepID=UPI00191B4186|nr:ferrochelatase [Chlamydia sp. 17-3921]